MGNKFNILFYFDVEGITGLAEISVFMFSLWELQNFEIITVSSEFFSETSLLPFFATYVAFLKLMINTIKRVLSTILALICYGFFYLPFSSKPYVTEEELKLMLRGAILSGAIQEEEQVIISLESVMRNLSTVPFFSLQCHCNDKLCHVHIMYIEALNNH